jgi:hypothetical protein
VIDYFLVRIAVVKSIELITDLTAQAEKKYPIFTATIATQQIALYSPRNFKNRRFDEKHFKNSIVLIAYDNPSFCGC